MVYCVFVFIIISNHFHYFHINKCIILFFFRQNHTLQNIDKILQQQTHLHNKVTNKFHLIVTVHIFISDPQNIYNEYSFLITLT